MIDALIAQQALQAFDAAHINLSVHERVFLIAITERQTPLMYPELNKLLHLMSRFPSRTRATPQGEQLPLFA